MAKGKTPAELEQVAQNICAQRGLDLNQAMSEFKKTFGGLIS